MSTYPLYYFVFPIAIGSREVSLKQREQANIIIACSHQKFYLNIIANNPSSEQDWG